MSDIAIAVEEKQQVAEASNPFGEGAWKSSPTPTAEVTDPVIEEKDTQIKEDNKENTKPDQPEAVPAASPHPIQDRPENTDERTKNDEPLKFANEESERIYNLILEGKKDEVFSVLAEQKKLAEVDKLPASDIIKLNLQYQNKDFTPQEINDLFQDTYSIPEKPVQGYETDDEFKEKEDKYNKEVERIEKRIARDAKPAIAELQKLQKEIVLPDIKKSQTEKEPTQEELDAQKVQYESFLQTVAEGVQKFNGYESTFKDEEVEIKVGYKLTKEEKEQIQPLIALSNMDAAAFLKGIGWLDDKGNINTVKLTEDLPFILDKSKVINKIVSETGNKRHEASIKAIKNIDYSGGKGGNGDLGAAPEVVQKNFSDHFFSN